MGREWVKDIMLIIITIKMESKTPQIKPKHNKRRLLQAVTKANTKSPFGYKMMD